MFIFKLSTEIWSEQCLSLKTTGLNFKTTVVYWNGFIFIHVAF